jgi:hypothetical protein
MFFPAVTKNYILANILTIQYCRFGTQDKKHMFFSFVLEKPKKSQVNRIKKKIKHVEMICDKV